jgi:hypothetical protein
MCRSCNNCSDYFSARFTLHIFLMATFESGSTMARGAVNCLQRISNLGIIVWTELYLNHQVDWIVSTRHATLKKCFFFFNFLIEPRWRASLGRLKQFSITFYAPLKRKTLFLLTFVLVARVLKSRNLFLKRKTLLQGGQVTPKRFKLFKLPQ